MGPTLLLLAGCRTVAEAGTLKLGTPQALIRQDEETNAVPTVIVTLPVLASPAGGTTFQVSRDGQPVTPVASPSTSLPGGTDLIDQAALRTRLEYVVTATFLSGAAPAKATVGLAPVQTLQGFPAFSEPTQGSRPGARPWFRWVALGTIETARIRLDVTQSGVVQSWWIGRGKPSEYLWGEQATNSVTGHLGYPQRLGLGVETTAQLTAIAGPTERSGLILTGEQRSKPVTFYP